jgi:Ca2+-binding EF-hand superfamily protein
MKKLRHAISLFSLSLFCLPSAFAQPPGPGPGGPGGPGPGPGGILRMLPVMAALDADEDGDISSEEIANATAALKTLDKNKDGKLTEDELRPNFGGPGGPGFGGPGFGGPGFGGPGFGGPGFGGPGFGGDPEAMIAETMRLDKNDDGKLDRSELGERRQGLMARADADKDGFVTKDELTKAMTQRGGRGGFGGGRPGEGRPGEGRPGEDGPPGEGRRGGGTAAFIDRLFELDADKDGKLTREELSRCRRLADLAVEEGSVVVKSSSAASSC